MAKSLEILIKGGGKDLHLHQNRPCLLCFPGFLPDLTLLSRSILFFPYVVFKWWGGGWGGSSAILAGCSVCLGLSCKHVCLIFLPLVSHINLIRSPPPEKDLEG